MTERYHELARVYSDEYMEKIYYYCLKKTNSQYAAEDPASDITVAVLTRLSKGDDPANLPAWIWQIARNLYSRWAEKTHKARQRDFDTDADVIEDNDITADGAIILSEEYSSLRRELAFISADYRDIVVSFCIDDMSIKDIAERYRLPEGTVKARLHRARKKLKEGMEMAREFGPKSYKPELVDFAASGSQPT